MTETRACTPAALGFLSCHARQVLRNGLPRQSETCGSDWWARVLKRLRCATMPNPGRQVTAWGSVKREEECGSTAQTWALIPATPGRGCDSPRRSCSTRRKMDSCMQVHSHFPRICDSSPLPSSGSNKAKGCGPSGGGSRPCLPAERLQRSQRAVGQGPRLPRKPPGLRCSRGAQRKGLGVSGALCASGTLLGQALVGGSGAEPPSTPSLSTSSLPPANTVRPTRWGTRSRLPQCC